MSDTTQKPSEKDTHPVDEYHGAWKDGSQASEEEKYGNSQNPVRNDPLPAKNLKSVGG